MLKLVRYGVVVCSVIMLLEALFHLGCSTVAERPPDGRLPPRGLDFATRCASPGVVRCVSFDSDSDFNFGVGGTNGAYGQNFGYMPPSGTSDYTRILRDTAFKASGTSSLRFTVPSQSRADTSGTWFANFSPTLNELTGEGKTIFIQWRQRFNSDWVNTNWTTNDGRGIAQPKLLSVSAGDKPGVCNPSFPTSSTCPTSCVDIDVVSAVWAIGKHNTVLAYHSCQKFQPFEYFDRNFNAILVQNAIPLCRYPTYSVPPCIAIVPNEWMTFKVQITVGNFNRPNSTYRMWVGREGEPLVKILDFSGDTRHPWTIFRNTTNEFGKVWLLPYITAKNPRQVHNTGYVWYDDLIISTQDIADPGGTRL